MTDRGRGDGKSKVPLSHSGEAPPLSGHGEGDSEIPGPRPQGGGVGDRHLQELAVVLEVRVPGGLE